MFIGNYLVAYVQFPNQTVDFSGGTEKRRALCQKGIKVNCIYILKFCAHSIFIFYKQETK